MRYVFGDFCLDARQRTLTRGDGSALALTPKLFDTLQFMLEHPGQDLDKDRLMAALWPGLVVEENNLSQAVSGLRKLLGDDGAANRFIVTVPRRGYRFVAEVRPADEPAPPRPPMAPTAKVEPQQPPIAPPSQADASPRTEAATTATAHRLHLLAGLACLAVLALAIAAWQWLRAPQGDAVAAANHTIAVLPFSNLGGAKEDEFFSEGITEDMVTQLAQMADLRVTSRTSASRFKDSKLSLRDIARELGVAYVLVGTVRRGDQRFRITAQLVDAAHDQNLWARTYDRGDADILAVQREVATDIASSLKGSLPAGEADQLARRAQGNPEAFLAYLRGNYEMRFRLITARDEFEGAPQHYQKAIALDPGSPLGYVGMANYHFSRARLGYFEPLPNYQAADGYLAKALALDARSVEAHIQLARLRGLGQWNWPEAAKAARRATELDPNNAFAWDAYRQTYLEPLGQLDEALAVQQRAVALDPVSSHLAWRLSQLHVRLGNCDEAMRQSRFNSGRDPSYTIQHTVMVSCLEKLGRLQEAIAENRQVKGTWLSDEFLDSQQAALAKDGAKGYWRAKLAQQHQLVTQRSDAWYFTAATAMMAGDKEEAYRALDKAITALDRNAIYLKTDWEFQPLHGEPRFEAALKRLNLK